MSSERPQEEDGPRPTNLAVDSFDSDYNIGDIVVDLDGNPAPPAAEGRGGGGEFKPGTSDSKPVDEESPAPVRRVDDDADPSDGLPVWKRYRKLALVVSVLIVGILAAALAVTFTRKGSGEPQTASGADVREPSLSPPTIPADDAPSDDNKPPNDVPEKSVSPSDDMPELTTPEVDVGPDTGEVAQTPISNPTLSDNIAPCSDVPELTACLCHSTASGGIDAGAGTELRIGGTEHRCTRDNLLNYQPDGNDSLAICIFPTDFPSYRGCRINEDGIDLTITHLEKGRTFMMRNGEVLVHKEDIVRLDQNATSNAMALTVLRPLKEVFPNLVLDFGGTLEVEGKVRGASHLGLAQQENDGGASFEFLIELVPPKQGHTADALSLSSCLCRPAASSDSSRAAAKGNALLIGGINHHCTQDDRLNSSSLLSICVFPDDILQLEGYQMMKDGLNLNMTHLEKGRTFMMRNGEVLVHKKDIVQLDQNSTSIAMVLTIVRPIREVFPNLVLNFGGTLDVVGELPLEPKDERGGDEDVRALFHSKELQTGFANEEGDMLRSNDKAQQPRGLNVEDDGIEIATFQLLIELITPTETLTSLQNNAHGACENTPGYVDKYGNGCGYYEAEGNYPRTCRQFGEEANGEEGGGSPNDNCCACLALKSPTVLASSDTSSLSSCKNMPGFRDAYGVGCRHYESEENYPHACQHYGGEAWADGTPNENCCVCKALLSPREPTLQPSSQS